jgi:hypothetical protein
VSKPTAEDTLGTSARCAQQRLNTALGFSIGYREIPMRLVLAALLATILLPQPVKSSEIESVVAHPPVDAFFSCSEHWQGQLQELGDDLGKDCVVQRLVEDEGRVWSRAYATDGKTNEDWFGWGAQLFSPCACVVTKIHENPQQNEPGRLGSPPASHIILRREDGVHFLLAHIQLPSVAVGDTVSYGQPLAQIGNNGYGRSPHLHIGAWRDGSALQIRWDQSKMRMPPEHRPKAESEPRRENPN